MPNKTVRIKDSDDPKMLRRVHQIKMSRLKKDELRRRHEAQLRSLDDFIEDQATSIVCWIKARNKGATVTKEDVLSNLNTETEEIDICVDEEEEGTP